MNPRCQSPGPAATVLVTSYRRQDRLVGCLDGLRAQSRRPDEVLVVIDSSDEETADSVERRSYAWPELRYAKVAAQGSVAALNCGLAAAQHPIVAIIDDDAVPAQDWLARILATYAADDRIGAVGGRDIVVIDGSIVGPPRRRFPGQGASADDVGRIQWFGRLLANHHVGTGQARDVDVLKGANMSVRRDAVIGHGYDERLRGEGAIVHTELSICLPLRRKRYRVVYDPSIVVMHYPAQRPHGDHRATVGLVVASSHNEALQILDYFGPFQRLVFAIWGVAIGTTEAPGAVVLIRDLISRRPDAWRRFVAAQRGRASAWKTRRLPRRVPEILTF
jgi:cellulose synthase/poly-beta-1,6-N-acetylglucosamine synthase-like glycosyltransferase